MSREKKIKKQTHHPIGDQNRIQPPYMLLDIGKVKNYLRFLLYKMDPLSIHRWGLQPPHHIILAMLTPNIEG